MTDGAPEALLGRRILIVEDEYTVATDLARALEERGVDVVGPVASVQEALNLSAAPDAIDGAILDINLRGERVYPLAEALRARGVPFVFLTGYDASVIPAEYADVQRLRKPIEARTFSRLFNTGDQPQTPGGGARPVEPPRFKP